ncbi:MAG: hypothetical protein WCA16_09780 [Candidatus Sulfotelmatobacter sp.]
MKRAMAAIVIGIVLIAEAAAQAPIEKDYPLTAELKSVRYGRGCCDYAIVVIGNHTYELERHSWKGYELGEYHVRIRGSKMDFKGKHNGKESTWTANIRQISHTQ